MLKLPVSEPSGPVASGADVVSFSQTFPPFDAIVGVIFRRTSVPESAATSPPGSTVRGSRPVYAGKRYSSARFFTVGRSTTVIAKVGDRTPFAST